MVWRRNWACWLLALVLPMGAQADDPSLASEIKTPDWKLWLPAGLKMRAVEGCIVHAENTEDSIGWPLLDGVLEPLNAGLTVVQDDSFSDFDELVGNHERLFSDPELYTRLAPVIHRDITLADGQDAVWIQTLVMTLADRRVQWVGKLFARGDDDTVWIVTAFIKTSEAGWPYTSRERLPWVLARHAHSLTFNLKQESPTRLLAVLTAPQQQMAIDIKKCLEANRALKKGHPRDARDLYRLLLQESKDLPFALMAQSQCEVDLGILHEGSRATAERAVMLTDGNWIPAYDTLAAICLVQGDPSATRDALNHILGMKPPDRQYWLDRLAKLDDS